MFRKIRQHKKKLWLSILTLVILSVYLYQESRPTVIFHTYKESGYLGKVSTFSGSIDKLYIKIIFHNIGCRIFGIGMEKTR